MTPTNWREEVDEMFIDRSNERMTSKFEGLLGITPTSLKSFITSLLVSLKDEVGKERRYHNDWDDLFKGKDPSGEQTKAIYTNGHNSALTKVEDIISKAIDG